MKLTDEQRKTIEHIIEVFTDHPIITDVEFPWLKEILEKDELSDEPFETIKRNEQFEKHYINDLQMVEEWCTWYENFGEGFENPSDEPLFENPPM